MNDHLSSPIDKPVSPKVEDRLHRVAQDVGAECLRQPGNNRMLCFIAILIFIDQQIRIAGPQYVIKMASTQKRNRGGSNSGIVMTGIFQKHNRWVMPASRRKPTDELHGEAI